MNAERRRRRRRSVTPPFRSTFRSFGARRSPPADIPGMYTTA